MWQMFCDKRFLPLLTTEPRKQKSQHWLAMLLLAISTTGIIAVAGPSYKKLDSPQLESIAARVFIIDLSRSMLVEDVKPNRVTKALNIMRLLIESGFDGETGLIVFSGAAFVVSPLTHDSNTLLEFSNALHPDAMPVDGERLDLAIDQASVLLSASISKTGQLVIFSDGAADIEKTIISARSAANQGHQISILAPGSLQGAPLKNTDGSLKQDDRGAFMLAKINFSELDSIAQAGQGQLLRLTHNNDDVESLVAHINSTSHQGFQTDNPDSDQTENSTEWENAGIWLVWLMLPMTLLLFQKNVLWIVLIATISIIAPINNDLYAGDNDNDWLWLNGEQRAHRAYQNNDYRQVIQLTNNPALIGAAQFESQNYKSAFDAFSSQPDSAHSLYNRANALAFQQKFGEALISYDRSLAIDARFKDARINKRLIETYLLANPTSDDRLDESKKNGDPNLAAENEVQPIIGESEPLDNSRADVDLAGVGAGLQFRQGRIMVADPFDGMEVELEQLTMRLNQQSFTPNAVQLKLWTDSLTNNPTELFRRKFLRDYQRSQQKPAESK
jgi:Ca-activated chloride channel family protein